jgi:feruloyl-CoA synthase
VETPNPTEPERSLPFGKGPIRGRAVECRKLADADPGAAAETVLLSNEVRAEFERLLNSFAETSTGSSTLMERILLLAEPARLDLHELTDKGTINQKQVLQNRDTLVEELYQAESSPRIISIRNGVTT